MDELSRGLHRFDGRIPHIAEGRNVTVGDIVCYGSITAERWASWGLEDFNPQRDATRLECAVAIDNILRPFDRDVNLNGEFVR
jgi:hypothetical protein